MLFRYQIQCIVRRYLAIWQKRERDSIIEFRPTRKCDTSEAIGMSSEIYETKTHNLSTKTDSECFTYPQLERNKMITNCPVVVGPQSIFGGWKLFYNSSSKWTASV